ncbi:MAG: DUF5671 domain-containing protein [Chloroflexota bacterium]|nr:DUF5671 domain-containing protein [Chloroflexota bacterium]
MIAIRRIYVYVLAFAGLLMLAGGAANLGRVLVEVLATTPAARTADYVRDEVSRWAAAALIGLPVWLIHWWWAQRLAARSADERGSALRRGYLYVVLTVALAATADSAHHALAGALDTDWSAALPPLPVAVVGIVVWLFNWQVARADRAAVGEAHASATLRRWYIYATAVLGWLEMLGGARLIVQSLWISAATGRPSATLTDGTPDALVGLGVWLLQGVALARRFATADRLAALPSVSIFVSLAVAVAASVFGLSQALYYALARALGVERPGGVGGSLLEAAAEPVALALVYGLAWWWLAGAARRQGRDEAPRQAGARRLYTYLVALVALVALAVGVAGLLWIVADALTAAPAAGSGAWWSDRVALFVTLTLVGLPVWALHWKPSAGITSDEAGSLSRRVYLYLVLVGASLTVLFSLATSLYRLLTVWLGAPATPSLASDLAHDLANALVAGMLLGYHTAALRGEARLAPGRAPAGPVEAEVRLRASDATALEAALADLRRRGIEVEPTRDARPPARTSPPAG